MPEAKRHVIGVSRAENIAYPLSYWMVDSGRDGPAVLVTSAMHGDELHGTEAVRRMMPEIEAELKIGRCILVPFANPCAVQLRQPIIDFDPGYRYVGEEIRRNVNLAWPGNPDGTDAERLAAALKTAVVDEATHLLDLHAWGDYCAATALCAPDDRAGMRLAGLVGVPFARARAWMPGIETRPVLPCTLRAFFEQSGRTALCVEFSGQYRVREHQVEMAQRAIRNYLRGLGMLSGRVERSRPTYWLDATAEVMVGAPVTGLFVHAENLHPGDDVRKGQHLGYVVVMHTLRVHHLYAPAGGRLYLYGPNHIPRSTPHLKQIDHAYVECGEPLARIVPSARRRRPLEGGRN